LVFRHVCVPVGLAVLALGPGARAQRADGASREAAPDPQPIEIGVTGFGRLDFANFCEPEGALCKSGPLYAGAALAPRYRFSPLLSLGAFGAFAWKLGSDAIGNSAGSVEFGFTNFRAEVEARLHPLGPGDVDLWLGADVGLAGRRQSTDVFDADGRHTESRSNTELSPIGGLSLGVDFHVADFLALGPEFRVAVLTIRDDPALAVSLGLSGTLLFPAP
jgi:hypothetical protein